MASEVSLSGDAIIPCTTCGTPKPQWQYHTLGDCVTCLKDQRDAASVVLRALLDEVSYVSKGPAHRAALEWRERNRGR